MKRLVLLNFTLLALASRLFSAPAVDAVPPVGFAWFEYTGSDAVSEESLPKGFYRNPILAGFHPDPSVCRVGDDYYLINSTFAYFPGIPIFHSRDLVNWTPIGHVIDRPEQLKYDGLGVSQGIFAPAISHHNGRFYVVCTHVGAGGNFFVTATHPEGPWSNPTWLDVPGIDPSFFFDDDGRAWLVHNGLPEGKPLYDGHRAIWLREFDLKTQTLVGPPKMIVDGGVDPAKKPIWIEGPHLYKRGAWYYLCCAEGGTGDNHSEVVFRSKSVTGPFLPWEKNPILTQRDLPRDRSYPVTSTGHADLFRGPNDTWWAVFLGCRPYQDGLYATGRETFLLPVTWTEDNWPVILPPGQSVPLVAPRPQLTAASDRTGETTTPLTGNFTWRDRFTSPTLSPLWVQLRQPHDSWWTLQNPAGPLNLTPRPDLLSGTGNPAFLGRRVQHARFAASTALTVPLALNVSAGLAVFQNETHHYYLGVRRTKDGLTVFVERWNGKAPEIVVSRAISDTPQLELKITGRDASCAFAYASEAGEWKTLLPEADATLLTTQAAGGFVGAMIGPHARIER